MLTREHRSTRSITCPSVMLPITNTLKINLVLNPGLRGEGPGTSWLNHGTASPGFHFKKVDLPSLNTTSLTEIYASYRKGRPPASTLLT